MPNELDLAIFISWMPKDVGFLVLVPFDDGGFDLIWFALLLLMLSDLLERFNDSVGFLCCQMEINHVPTIQRVISVLIITISNRTTLRFLLAEVHLAKVKIVIEPGHHLSWQLVV